jgi:hypothetical protein
METPLWKCFALIHVIGGRHKRECCDMLREIISEMGDFHGNTHLEQVFIYPDEWIDILDYAGYNENQVRRMYNMFNQLATHIEKVTSYQKEMQPNFHTRRVLTHTASFALGIVSTFLVTQTCCVNL